MRNNPRASTSIIGPPWLVFIISTAIYLVLLYLSQPFSNNDELAVESLAGGFALLVSGIVIVDTACIWLKVSQRSHYYVQLFSGLLIVALSLTLPWIVPQNAYHQRWMFLAFSCFGGGWYMLFVGGAHLAELRKAAK